MSGVSNKDRLIFSFVALDLLKEQLRIVCQHGFVENMPQNQGNMMENVNHHNTGYAMNQDLDFSHHYVNQPPPQQLNHQNQAGQQQQHQMRAQPPPTNTSKKSKASKKTEPQNQPTQQQFNLHDL